jgi:hypothetical protein
VSKNWIIACLMLGLGAAWFGSRPSVRAGQAPQVAGRESLRSEASKRGWVAWAEVLPGDEGLRVQWWGTTGAEVELLRAVHGSTNFTRLHQGRGPAEFLDRGVVPGQRYVYRLQTGYHPKQSVVEWTAGVRLPPVEDRGTVALLVDETLAGALHPELGRLEQELIGDGWKVLRRNVPRHDDREWSRNTNAIARIRAQVKTDWEASGKTLRCLFIIGHVAIPYSGMYAEDLHTGRGDNHFGAWPSDQYYGDVDGDWTDRQQYPNYLAPVSFPITRNDPGDGKFDWEHVPPNASGDTRLEMAFGRLDFFRMPSFGKGERGEIALLKQYFDKARRYRMGGMPTRPGVMAAGYFQNAVDLDLLMNAYRTGSRLFGGTNSVVEGDFFGLPSKDAMLWGFQSGSGYIDRIRSGSPGVVTSSSLASPKREAKVVFSMLLGSWFGDWAVGEDNLLRAITASKDYGLASMWVRTAEWRFDPLAWGGTLGDGQLLTANESLRFRDTNRGTTRTLTILGDPTLRAHVVPPVRGLKGQRTDRSVRLSWAEGTPGVLGWNVYRSTNGPAGPYERIHDALITNRDYRDNDTPVAVKYMVRAAELVTTGSGSYTNLSQGTFWP